MREDLWFGAVPVLLAGYAVARPIDGRDGEYGPGPAWNVGHLAFLGAVLGVGAVTVALWRRSPRRQHPGVVACAVAALVGVGLFCWVILTDLVPALDENAPLPEPLMAVGPPLFVLGFVGTLAVHCAVASVPWWPVHRCSYWPACSPSGPTWTSCPSPRCWSGPGCSWSCSRPGRPSAPAAARPRVAG